jgi:hypothetical protein
MIQQEPGASGAISWIVVKTHPRMERFAVESLNERQFAAYCPMVPKHIRHARQSKIVLRPLFPAHVFASVHVGQRWRPILMNTPGVSMIVRSGEALDFLPTGFIETLQDHDVEGKVVAPSSSRGGEQRGVALGSHFNELIATMLQISELDRLFTLIRLLQPGVGAASGVRGGKID